MESSERTKLFVGGVSRDTTEDTLREYFSRFGQVEESLIIRDRLTGIARGFGFVTLSNSSMASEALRVRHVILGRTVDVKPAKTKTNRQECSSVNGSNANITLPSKKIFVGGLPHNLTVEEFKSYFEKFGTVTDVVVIFDKENHRPRGFGFITFDSEDAVDKVLQNSFYELKNKMVEVKRAQPKDRNDNYYDYYDCYNTGLGLMYSYPYHCYSAAFQPNGYYGRWNPYPFGPSTGGWIPPVAAPSSSSRHGYLASGNPSFHNLVPCFSGSGVYMNGWTSGAMDLTNRDGNLNRDFKSARGNSNKDHNESGGDNSNKDYDGGNDNSNGSGNARRDCDDSAEVEEVEVLVKNSESNSGDHQRRVIDDSSTSLKSSDEELCLRSNAGENQNGEIYDSSGLKGVMNGNRQTDGSQCLKGSAAEHQEGEHQKEDDNQFKM